MIIVDASVVGPLMLPDEQETLSAELAEQLLGEPFLVPMHWHLEIASMFEVAVRRQRISQEQCRALLRRTALLAIEIDPKTSEKAWSETLDLVRAYRLSVYDAAYLELALRANLPLASLDGDLVAAAKKAGASLHPLAA